MTDTHWTPDCTCTPGKEETGWHEERCSHCRILESDIWRDMMERWATKDYSGLIPRPKRVIMSRFDDEHPRCAICEQHATWVMETQAWHCAWCQEYYQPSLGHYYRKREWND